MVKRIVLFILLFSAIAATSQIRSGEYFFKNEIRKEAHKYSRKSDFYKAWFFFREKEWDSTLYYCDRQLRKAGKNKRLRNYCHLFRGTSFREKKLMNQARKELLSISDDFLFYPLVKLNLGEIDLEQNKFTEALTFFKHIETQEKKGIYFKESSLYHNIGLCNFHLGQFAEAEKYLFKGLHIQLKDKDTVMIIGSYMDIANLYYGQYKDTQAIPYFRKAYDLSKKVKGFELKQNAALNMAVVEENRKNPLQALAYRKEYEIWKDSLNDQNKVWAIAETEKKYAIKQKQKEIDLLASENKLKNAEKNASLAVAVLFLALFGTGVYFYRQKIKANKIILSQKMALDELNSSKDQLFSIVSHDLRSSVNALRTSNDKLLQNLESENYTEVNKLLRNNSMIANSVYRLLDNLLNWAMLQTKQSYFHKEFHRLAAIISQTAYNYMPLMTDKEIIYENNVPEDVIVYVDLDSVKIVFRNLLDNAIKFSSANDTISVYIQNIDNHHCTIVVEDTGAGMNQDMQDKIRKESFTAVKSKGINTRSGLGMQLCKSLIGKNNGELMVESSLGIGTKIIVSLPVNASYGQH